MNVDPTYKGKRLGIRLIKTLKEIGLLHNCYKIVLDCEDHNIEFYKLVSLKVIESVERILAKGEVHVLVQERKQTLT